MNDLLISVAPEVENTILMYTNSSGNYFLLRKGPVTLCNFLSNLSRTAPRNEKQEVCACAFVKTAIKIARQVAGGVIHCAMVLSIAAIRCEKLSWVLLRATLCATKKLRDNPCYTVQFSSNLSRNGIARQVAEKIAQCNRALTEQSCTYLFTFISLGSVIERSAVYSAVQRHRKASKSLNSWTANVAWLVDICFVLERKQSRNWLKRKG